MWLPLTTILRILFFFHTLWGTAYLNFQLSCSTYNSISNRYFLPNLGGRDKVLALEFWEGSPPGTRYIYPVEGLNCSGIITEVEFCYTISSSMHYGANQFIFSLYVWSINGFNLSTLGNVEVYSSPNAEKCGEDSPSTFRCCDAMILESDITLQSSIGRIAIGIGAPSSSSSNVILQGFYSSTSMSYTVPVYIHTVPLASVRQITPNPTTGTFRFVWLHIESDTSQTSFVPMDTTTTSRASSQSMSLTTSVPMDTTITSKTSSQPISEPGISLPTDQMTTSLPISLTMTPTPTPHTTTITTKTSQMTPTERDLNIVGTDEIVGTDGHEIDGAVSGAAIGGAVGGALVLIILIISSITVLLLFIEFHKRKKCTLNEPSNNLTDKAVLSYDMSTAGKSNGIANPEYGYSTITEKVKKEISTNFDGQKEHEYDYPQVKVFAGSHPLTEKIMEASPYEYAVPSASTIDAIKTNGNVALVEDIYMVPPCDITQLYAKLEEVRADKLTRDNVKLKNLLGSGQFGEVYQGVWNCLDRDLEVAVKTLKVKSTEQDRIKFLQEAAIMGQFRHENVVTMYGVISEGEPVLLVLELLKKGDLRQHLLSLRMDKGNEIALELKNVYLLTYCRQVASGMDYLSKKTFVHRDLAARNILVSENDTCKIADFGMSRDLMDENYYVSKGGMIPLKWTAPEALHYKKYSTASDIWSFGAVLYEIWSVGHKPFEGVSNSKVLELIDSGYRLPPPPGCPRAIYSIMISCWHPSTSKRPTFSDIHSQLSTSNLELLHLSEENENVSSNATKLGAELECANNMFKDLQVKYLSTC